MLPCCELCCVFAAAAELRHGSPQNEGASVALVALAAVMPATFDITELSLRHKLVI